MAGLTYLDATTWQYENAGTADTLTIGGTTLNNLPLSQSRTGSAFYQTAYQKCFDLPATSEVWIKFDVYFDGSNRWRAYNGGANGTNGVTAYSGSYAGTFAHAQNGSIANTVANICKTNQLQTVLLHMISGTSDGIVEAWVDGTLIYSYSGDVNHGSDFADIYLQSDGAGTFFSNVIISNAQIGLNQNIVNYSCELKPEIYISYIPTGKIGLKPQIYATYIPTPEKSHADLLRKITSVESSRADSLRQVGQGENIPADILRRVTAANETAADTKRKLFSDEQIAGDTFRRAVHATETHADTYREVKVSEHVIGDTSRRMGLINIRADLRRQVNVMTINTADICRKIGIAEKTYADIYLQTARGEFAEADTFRKVKATTSANADACRQIGIREKFSVATVRIVGFSQTVAVDIFLQITASEKIIADLLRGIRDVAHADTKRKLVRREKTVAQTEIRIPHILKYILQNKPRTLENRATLREGITIIDDSETSEASAQSELIEIDPYADEETQALTDTFKDYGITSINITLNEKTLSDTFQFSITRPMEINDAVQGQLFNYEFNFLVEETNQTDMGQSVKGMYSLDKLLYTWIPLKDLSDEEASAETYLDKISLALDLESVMHFDNFIPNNVSSDATITYTDLLQLLFGWTSQVPHKLVNVFIRGKKLYVIQRGMETAFIDITNLPHSRPTVNKKILRILCNNPNASNDDNDDNDNKKPFSGTIVYKKEGIVPYQAIVYMCLTYSYGLLQSEVTTTQTGMFVNEDGETVMLANHNVTSYSYISQYNEDTKEYEYYTSSKKQSTTTREQNMNTLEIYVTEQEISTTYGYSSDFNLEQRTLETYLFHECEQTKTTEYSTGKNRDKTITNTKRDTYHYPCGNGWYAQLVYYNGILQGSNISQGKPGGAVSQYTVDHFQESFHTATTDTPDGATPIIEGSFPVKDASFKGELNSELASLDRKIQEIVTVDLVSRVVNGVPETAHIVDFTERVKFNDNVYFLVSNTISFTPRKFIQKLQLIRWY